MDKIEINIQPRHLDKLRAIAADHGTTVEALAEAAIRVYLEREPGMNVEVPECLLRTVEMFAGMKGKDELVAWVQDYIMPVPIEQPAFWDIGEMD